MACFMKAIAVAIVVGSVVSGQKELEIDKDDNIEPFALLCRIYNVAKNPPINYVDLQEAQKIGEEIDALNASLAEEKVINETEQMGNSVVTQLQHTTTLEAALLQISLNQITQKAHTILDEIKRMKVTETIEKAKAEFNKVIFGENGNESDLEHTALNGVSDRAVACGKPGDGTKGDRAGNNIVVDFFCLCARRADEEGVNQVCGFFVGIKNSKIGWNESRPMGYPTMWASIKGGCGKHMQQYPKSTAEARHILDQFLMHLKTGGVYRQIKCEPDPPKCKNAIVEGSDRKVGMLGTGITVSGGSNFSCDGKEGGKKGKSGNNLKSGGACLYYGPESESWKDDIGWLKKFQTALTIVDAANNQTATIQRNIKKLQMFLHRAEEIYETTRVISEVQNTAGLTALQNVSVNLTAFNTTRTRSYGYSRHAYFALPWLLILP